MEKLLRGGFRDVSVHRCVSCRLLCAISLDNLARYLVKTTKDRGCRAVLTIDNGIKPAFHRRHNNWRELRPIEVLRYMLNVRATAPPYFALVAIIDNEFFYRHPSQHWRWTR